MSERQPLRILFLGRVLEDNGPRREVYRDLLLAAAQAALRRGQTIELLVPRHGLLEIVPPAVVEVVLPRFASRPLLWEQWTVPAWANGNTRAVLYTAESPVPPLARIPAFAAAGQTGAHAGNSVEGWIWRQLHERTTSRSRILHAFSKADNPRVRVVAPGIDQTLFSARNLTAEEQKEYRGLREAGLQEPFVLQSGPAGEGELRALLAAFRHFADRQKKVQLVLTSEAAAAPGPKLERTLDRMPDDRVFRLGGVTRNDLAYLYQKASYVILSSACSAQDVMEAQSSGCPLLAPALGHFSDVLEGSALYHQASPRDLLDKILQMHDAELRGWYKLMSVSNAVEFSWQSVGERWLDLAEEVWRVHQSRG